MNRARRTCTTLRVYVYKYGTGELGYSGFQDRRRLDRYTPNDGGRPTIEAVFALNHEDDTPTVSTYAHQLGDIAEHVRAYNADCPSCYLGYPHTTALHDARIAALRGRKD